MMYEFTNGLVAFDEETKEKYINAGFKLVEKEEVIKPEKEVECVEENRDRTITEKHKRSNKSNTTDTK